MKNLNKNLNKLHNSTSLNSSHNFPYLFTSPHSLFPQLTATKKYFSTSFSLQNTPRVISKRFWLFDITSDYKDEGFTPLDPYFLNLAQRIEVGSSPQKGDTWRIGPNNKPIIPFWLKSSDSGDIIHDESFKYPYNRHIEPVLILGVHLDNTCKVLKYFGKSKEYLILINKDATDLIYDNHTDLFYNSRIKDVIKEIKATNLVSPINSTSGKTPDSVWASAHHYTLYIHLASVEFWDRDMFLEPVRQAFVEALSEMIKLGPGTYTALVKAIYSTDSYSVSAFMLGHQTGFIITDDDKSNYEVIKGYGDTLISRLHASLENYKITNISYLQVMYILNPAYSEYKIVSSKQAIAKLDKQLINKRQTKDSFNIVPVYFNELGYGTLLKSSLSADNKKVESVIINNTNFIDTIKKAKLLARKEFEDLKPNTKFFLTSTTPKSIAQRVIAVTELERTQSTYTKRLDVYSLTGDPISEGVVDRISGLPSPDIPDSVYTNEIMKNIRVVRRVNNIEMEYFNNEIIRVVTHHTLKDARPRKFEYKPSTNPFIGTFDIETYVNDDGGVKAYALGFTTSEMVEGNVDQKCKTFFLHTDGNSAEELILNCLNAMLIRKYNNYKFYVHNLGGYDVAFILKTIKDYNLRVNKEHYIADTIFRDNSVLRLAIKVRINDEYIKIQLVDSLTLLQINLDTLSKAFNAEYKKGCFPHEFVKEDTLDYVGDTPRKAYFKIKGVEINDEMYSKLSKPNWSLRDECIKYLESDLLALLRVIEVFNNYVFIEHGVDPTESLTISRLALNIFFKKYYKPTKENKIGVVDKPKMYSEIKQGYIGGITEVYKPRGQDLFYYDVNSLYPFAVTSASMPGNVVKHINDSSGIDITNKFGFFNCEVEAPKDLYIGLLPMKTSNGGVVSPVGKWKGWYFSEEIKFAMEHGYKVRTFEGWEFNRIENLFDNYVKDLYKIKSECKGAKRFITKLLLNSLLGRFGLNIEKPRTELVNKEKYLKLIATHKLHSNPIIINDNTYIVTYNQNISPTICKEHNLDYVSILNHQIPRDMESYNQFADVAVSVAAATTSYARIYMNKLKAKLLKHEYGLYYMDTDSLVIDKPLDPELIGEELGLFKLECKIKDAYFITGKTYCLVLDNGKTIIKAKGVNESSLSIEKFKQLYAQHNVTAVKRYSKVFFDKGYTTIGTQNVTLNHNAYRKRTKIYDNFGNWVDTAPLVLCFDKFVEDIRYSELSRRLYPNVVTKLLPNLRTPELLNHMGIYLLPTITTPDHEISLTGSLKLTDQFRWFETINIPTLPILSDDKEYELENLDILPYTPLPIVTKRVSKKKVRKASKKRKGK